jgi:hypothetical protein
LEDAMQELTIQAYFDISRKGRGRLAQALLQSLRDQAKAMTASFVLLETDGKSYHFYRTDDPEVFWYQLYGADRLPAALSALKPVRVVLTGSHHFNFPQEGIYEGGGEVYWETELHNEYTPGFPTIVENTWHVTIEANSVEEALEQLRRIRTGGATLLTRYVNHLSGAERPQETGLPERPDGYGPDGLHDDADDGEVRVLPG